MNLRGHGRGGNLTGAGFNVQRIIAGGRSSLSESRKAYNRIYSVIAKGIEEGEMEMEVKSEEPARLVF